MLCVSWGQRGQIEEDNIDIDMTKHAIQVSQQRIIFKPDEKLLETVKKSKGKLLEKDDWQAEVQLSN